MQRDGEADAMPRVTFSLVYSKVKKKNKPNRGKSICWCEVNDCPSLGMTAFYLDESFLFWELKCTCFYEMMILIDGSCVLNVLRVPK